jgi:toxin CptA
MRPPPGALVSIRHPPGLVLHRGPSRMLAAALIVVHCVALGVAVFAVPGFYWAILGCSAIVLHGTWVTGRHALLLHPRSIVSLRFDGEDQCVLECRDGSSFAGCVHGRSYVARHLVLVRIKFRAWRPCAAVPLLPDNLSTEEFRRLRVRLRWSRVGEIGAAMPDTSL